MAISTADFKNGMCIEYNNKLWTIAEFQHVKPGKGGAFVRTKLRDIKTGRVVDYTFNSGTKFDSVRLETKKMQYLYNDGADFNFMDPVTFEQLITVLANCSAKSEDLPSAQESSKVLSSFKDGQSVSAWAQANMAWAVENGLVSGYDEPDGQYLRPGEEVARERVAVILMRAFQSGILK